MVIALLHDFINPQAVIRKPAFPADGLPSQPVNLETAQPYGPRLGDFFLETCKGPLYIRCVGNHRRFDPQILLAKTRGRLA